MVRAEEKEEEDESGYGVDVLRTVAEVRWRLFGWADLGVEQGCLVVVGGFVSMLLLPGAAVVASLPSAEGSAVVLGIPVPYMEASALFIADGPGASS